MCSQRVSSMSRLGTFLGTVDRNNRINGLGTHCFFRFQRQNRHKIRQIINRLQPLKVGKDEVGSSNLPSSSNKNRSNLRIWAVFAMFSALFRLFCIRRNNLVSRKKSFLQVFLQLLPFKKVRNLLIRKRLLAPGACNFFATF